MREVNNENIVSHDSPMNNNSMITGKIEKIEDLDESLEQIRAERRKMICARMGRANRGKALTTKNIKKKPVINKGGNIPMNENYNEEVLLEESVEGNILINEAILEENNVQLSYDELDMLIESELLSEKSIVRLDKVAKRSLAEKKALIVIAKEKNDPLYRELVKVYKRKRMIIDKIDKKYGSQAIQRVRKNSKNMAQKGIGSLMPKLGGEKRGTDIKAPKRNMPADKMRQPNQR